MPESGDQDSPAFLELGGDDAVGCEQRINDGEGFTAGKGDLLGHFGDQLLLGHGTLRRRAW
jgi:hypothetical protein